MSFSQCYAGSTVCAPSRCSLMTGMHNGHNRIRDNLPHNVWLRPDDLTVAEVLKQAGFRTIRDLTTGTAISSRTWPSTTIPPICGRTTG
ncbi:MAG: sulfatase-like hydrolase/transferase [Planctomycetota bacterium]|jgi:arylsulfatase A-like enzyme